MVKKPNISESNFQKYRLEWHSGTDAIFEEIMAENFTNMMKNTSQLKKER